MTPNVPSEGRVHGLHTSRGGVPKLPVSHVDVEVGGIRGDAHNDTKHHGGPQRAVCLLALEVIEALRADRHPITPGSTGENITLQGLGTAFPPGTRVQFGGGAILEITQPASPCPTIRESFVDGQFQHLHANRDPEQARHYARVIAVGRIAQGESVTKVLPG